MARDTQGFVQRIGYRARSCAVVVAGLIVCAGGAQAAGGPPEIRMTASNRVPACVTPERLMAFLGTRNSQLHPKFATIAATYRSLGEAARVRWDYAFFQMVLETNYLMFKRGDGSSGDVGLAQNNFAGIGATGGGVPGDRFPDVKTGVLAQIQHLTAYSGEKVAAPVATRTRERQDDIIDVSRRLGRPVTFGDLAKRWAVDHAYARNIEFIADQYRGRFCTGAGTVNAAVVAPAPVAAVRPQSTPAVANGSTKLRPMMPPPNKLGAASVAPPEPTKQGSGAVRTVWRRGDLVAPAPRPAVRSMKSDVKSDMKPNGFIAVALPPVVLKPVPVALEPGEPVSPVEQRLAFAAGARALAPVASPSSGACQIHTADLGGSLTVLVRADVGPQTRLTALTVEAARAQVMTDSFVAAYAPGGASLGSFDSPAQAVAAARMVCQSK